MSRPPYLTPNSQARVRGQLVSPSNHRLRWISCTLVSLSLHMLLLYLLAPWWMGGPVWTRDTCLPDTEPAWARQPSAVAFETPIQTSSLEELIELTNLPTIEEPVGSSPEPAPIESTATLPGAPHIAAPWAGREFRHEPARSVAERESESVQELLDPTELPIGGGFEGRTADARGKLASERGGSPRSEAAVEAGLAWIVAHQHPDGGWRFSHQGRPCDGQCRNSGSEPSTTAATGLALLPLLGAGHTPVEGQYAAAVSHGLEYLRERMIASPRGGDLQEGTMYGQGLATVALCEAYALSKEEALREPAQQALDFIVSTQHVRGGWRYYPGQPGDTTVLGWHWMALKSGQMAGLNVPRTTSGRAGEFLDMVQSDDGSAYGYQSPDAQPSPTAIGLLCRMYSGWRRTDARITRGVERLAAWGPSYDDMYFNYYATQVLHHQEGSHWPAWNERLREHLIASQAKSGHEAGSWHFADPHTTSGGRLCDTALALMILEVYYRHMPLYGLKTVEF